MLLTNPTLVLEKKGVYLKYINVIKDVYNGAVNKCKNSRSE